MSDREDLHSTKSVLLTMTFESGNSASKTPLKMPSDEENLGVLKVTCGLDGAHPLPEPSLQVSPKGLEDVPVPNSLPEARVYDQVEPSVLYDLLTP